MLSAGLGGGKGVRGCTLARETVERRGGCFELLDAVLAGELKEFTLFDAAMARMFVASVRLRLLLMFDTLA